MKVGKRKKILWMHNDWAIVRDGVMYLLVKDLKLIAYSSSLTYCKEEYNRIINSQNPEVEK